MDKNLAVKRQLHCSQHLEVSIALKAFHLSRKINKYIHNNNNHKCRVIASVSAVVGQSVYPSHNKDELKMEDKDFNKQTKKINIHFGCPLTISTKCKKYYNNYRIFLTKRRG